MNTMLLNAATVLPFTPAAAIVIAAGVVALCLWLAFVESRLWAVPMAVWRRRRG